MVLNVDLQCSRCYKKVKKVLCKFPQIQDQKYDEKANTVTITVVSCCPEKIRDKICFKGGGIIKCITIKPPPKPDPKPPPKQDPKPNPPKQDPKPNPPKPDPKPSPPCPPPPPPFGLCCMGCFHGHVWGPCYFGGPPPLPRPCYETCGRPVYDSCGCGCGGGYGNKYYNVSRGDCLCEENPQACTIM
ncbi:hypothetical protein CRYUN_Cryun40dG0065500 [Craigia yunnanensis]